MAAPAPSEGKVPFVQKVAIGFGEVASIGRQSIDQLALPVYHLMLGVSPLLVTSVMGGLRFLDAVTDPLAGSLSDNARTRWGRRKPFILAATLACALLIPVVWWIPQGLTQHGYFLYFLFTLAAFYSAYSFFDIPMIGLALEATPDYNERTRVAAYKAFFAHGSAILTGWLFLATQAKVFHSSLQGVRLVGIAMGLVTLAIGLVPVIFVREGYRKISVTKKGLPFWKGLRATFANRSFVLLCLITAGNKLSGALVQSLGLYLMIFYVYRGNEHSAAWLYGLWGSVYQATSVAIIPLVTWMATRLGKLKALHICLWTLIVGSLSKWFTFQPGLPYLTLITAVALGPGQTAFATVLSAIVADICDEDELRTGLRREGMYGSMQRWIEKATGSLAILVTGATLLGAHFKTGSVQQNPHTILILRMAYSFVPVLAVGLALIALAFFPLTAKRAALIRAELEARRGKPHEGLEPLPHASC